MVQLGDDVYTVWEMVQMAGAILLTALLLTVIAGMVVAPLMAAVKGIFREIKKTLATQK